MGRSGPDGRAFPEVPAVHSVFNIRSSEYDPVMERSGQSSGTTRHRPLSAPDGSLVRQASGEQAAAYIRRLIFDGELQPGTRLPQDQIAAALGVSRIPVREAIVALEREGWVTTRLHKGAFINSFDEDTIRDHYELFALIYGLAVRRTIARNDPDVITGMTNLARKVAETNDPSTVEEGALAFQGLVVDGAHSPRIRVVLRATSALVPGPFFRLVPDAIGPEQRGLTAIARAAKKGDPAKATDEYARMLRQQGEAVVELFRRRNLVTRSESA
jgi:DNA-binding GntR family transcriptional regulator